MLTLHEYAASGNCYKVRLAAAHAGLALARREYDIMKGETRTATFLREVDANGRIPVLETPDGMLPESNAAAWYVAQGSALIPAAPFNQAQLLRWLFWEQYHHEPNIATLRFWRRSLGEDRLSELQRALIPGKQEAGEAALALLDEHLDSRAFMLGNTLSLADICLYAYTHVAPEGGFPLNNYPAVVAWLGRVAAHPQHVAMEA